MIKPRVAVLGATSLVGDYLLPLLAPSYQVMAFTRQKLPMADSEVDWLAIDNLDAAPQITYLISVAPIWALLDYLPQLAKHPLQKIVVLSSTSIFTKTQSSDINEQTLAQRLSTAEQQIEQWATAHGIQWVVLRPTLIYSLGRDKNLTEIAHVIKKIGFFPILGQGKGLRQPIHAQDVAQACVAALCSEKAVNKSYNLSGAEILSYKQMVEKVFIYLGKSVRILTIPVPLFRVLVIFARIIPRYRHLSWAIAERMNQDMTFDHSEAKQDFRFSPRKVEM